MIFTVTLLVLAHVLFLQIKNLQKYRDGNGQEHTRKLFIAQVLMLGMVTGSCLFQWKPGQAFGLIVLAVNSMAFYYGWDIRKILTRNPQRNDSK